MTRRLGAWGQGYKVKACEVINKFAIGIYACIKYDISKEHMYTVLILHHSTCSAMALYTRKNSLNACRAYSTFCMYTSHGV